MESSYIYLACSRKVIKMTRKVFQGEKNDTLHIMHWRKFRWVCIHMVVISVLRPGLKGWEKRLIVSDRAHLGLCSFTLCRICSARMNQICILFIWMCVKAAFGWSVYIPLQCLISTRLSMAYRRVKDKHKKERSKGWGGFRVSPQFCQKLRNAPILQFCNYSLVFFTTTALEPPRRALDLHILAKHLALACACVTSWVTLRTSPPGMDAAGKWQMRQRECRAQLWHEPWFHFLPDSRILSTSISPCIHPWQLTLRTNWRNSRWTSIRLMRSSASSHMNHFDIFRVSCRNILKDCGRWWETGSIICTKLFTVLQKKFWWKGPMPLCSTLTLVGSVAIKFGFI